VKTFIVPYTASQLKLEATEAAALKPDFVFFNLWGDAPLLSGVGTLRQLGYQGPWTVTYDLIDNRTINLLGPNLGNGSWHQFSWIYDPTVPANKEYYQAFVEMYKNEQADYQEPNAWGEVYYSALMPLMLALDKAGTNEPVEFGQALHNLNWTTPTGDPLEISPSGLFYLPTWYVAELQDGKWQNLTKQHLSRADYY